MTIYIALGLMATVALLHYILRIPDGEAYTDNPYWNFTMAFFILLIVVISAFIHYFILAVIPLYFINRIYLSAYNQYADLKVKRNEAKRQEKLDKLNEEIDQRNWEHRQEIDLRIAGYRESIRQERKLLTK